MEVDEFHTFIGRKSNKVWLIYAYHRQTSEIVTYVWSKRDLETALRLKWELARLGITYDWIATDNWSAFIKTFETTAKHDIGKQHTVGIEGNNCRLRHRIRRAVRRSGCFSKQ